MERAINSQASEEMIDILKNQKYDDIIPKYSEVN